jgi:hypothetical protein
MMVTAPQLVVSSISLVGFPLESTAHFNLHVSYLRQSCQGISRTHDCKVDHLYGIGPHLTFILKGIGDLNPCTGGWLFKGFQLYDYTKKKRSLNHQL